MIAYEIDLRNVVTFEDFVRAFNSGMIDRLGGHWNGNLDAFNDYLYWPDPHPYRLRLHGWRDCSSRLSAMRTWDGRPMVSVIEDILAHNPQALVSFE